MFTVAELLTLIDTYKSAALIAEDKTLSYRLFGDSKKIGALRKGADITLGRCQSALGWFSENWPDHVARPAVLGLVADLDSSAPETQRGAA